MASAATAHPSPTFLGLPVELRRQILKYVFLAVCSPVLLLASKTPCGITLLFASQFPSSLLTGLNSGIYGSWGREPMTRILRVNSQILSEAVDVPYGGDFVFEFSQATRVVNVRFWLDLLGQKKKKIKHIGVSVVVVDLKMLSLLDHPGSSYAKEDIGVKKDAWAILRRELEGLKSVRIEISFVRTLEGGQTGWERLVEEVMELVRVFEGVKTVTIDGDRLNEERVRILDTCNEKMRNDIRWKAKVL